MTLPQPDAAFHWSREAWGVALRCRPLETATQHLFTSKQLALPDADSWRAALASVGASPDRLMRVKQVHGNTVRVLRRGEVPEGAAAMRPDGDAIVSNHPGLVLAVMVADCVPILIVDRVHGRRGRRACRMARHVRARGAHGDRRDAPRVRHPSGRSDRRDRAKRRPG